jgi:Flp pilus assembly protein TadB
VWDVGFAAIGLALLRLRVCRLVNDTSLFATLLSHAHLFATASCNARAPTAARIRVNARMARMRVDRATYELNVDAMEAGDSASQRSSEQDVARRELGIGGGLLAFSVVAIVLSFVLLTFGLAPIALLILALIPVALLGGWLRRRGTYRMRRSRRHQRRAV